MPSRLGDRDRADLALKKILKAARLFDRYGQLLVADGEIDLAPAASLAAALQDFHPEAARLRDSKLPARPVIAARPEAERVFVRQRFVAEHDAMHVGCSGRQRDRAVVGLRVGD